MNWRRRVAGAIGWLTTAPYRWRGSRVTIGRGLLGNGRLRISGPGRVVLEADVNAWSHAEPNRLITTRPEALIRIGPHARLNGCTLIAADRIEVGAHAVLGSCEVRDHLPYREGVRLRREPVDARPVVIESNAWLAGQVTVLPGVRIGRNAVVGIHAVVFDDVPADVVVAGNPARVVRQIEGAASGDNPKA